MPSWKTLFIISSKQKLIKGKLRVGRELLEHFISNSIKGSYKKPGIKKYNV